VAHAKVDSSDPWNNFPELNLVIFDETDESSKETAVYLCGNSLGLLPRETPTLLNQELQVWSQKGVHGHFDHPHNRPWVSIDDTVLQGMSKIVGAKENEVVVMNTLTGNLHFLMVSFYRPMGKRTKILMESKAFPSDYVNFLLVFDGKLEIGSHLVDGRDCWSR
jgi:kynureninase